MIVPTTRGTSPRRRVRMSSVDMELSGRAAVGFRRGLRRFDQFPELRILLKGFVFADGEVRTIEKILEAILIQNAVNQDPEFVALEIDSIIAQAEPVQMFAGALEAPVFLEIGLQHL